MISKGFYEQLETIAAERHIEIDDVLAAVKVALIKACQLEGCTGAIDVEFNHEQKNIRIYESFIVVDEIDPEGPEGQILLEQAKEIITLKRLIKGLENEPNFNKNDEYYNVDFNWNGGMKATHKDHNFDPKKGHYEKEVQNVGFDNGHSVIFTSEVSNIIYKKFTEGLWDDKKIEIAGCETATSNNILRGLKHCASKREKDIAVIYYPNGGFDKDVFDKAIKGYKGLEPQQDDQYLKFDKIICIENNRIVLEIPCP